MAKTERELFHLTLRAFGAVGSEGDQLAAIFEAIAALEARKLVVMDKARVIHAKETADKRLKPDHSHYGTHLRHCYGWDYDSVYGDEKPTTRYGCKYGEDDQCPAALFEDPWKEYCRAEDAGEI